MAHIGDVTSSQILNIQHTAGTSQAAQTSQASKSEFAEKLRQQTMAPQVQFSRHASMRMEQRGVSLTGENLEELSLAVERARMKGSRETVVIGKQGAFIVNVSNNVVVTTLTEQEMKQNIFTNIDSAVFM